MKSLNQLFITGEIDDKHIRADPRVHEEYNRLRTQDLPACIPTLMTACPTTKSTIPFNLLNVRSLRKHCTDLKFDSGVIHSDILAFTETILKPSQTTEFIEESLNAFHINRQDNDNDFLSLAFCIKINCQCFIQVFFRKINGLLETIRKSQI